MLENFEDIGGDGFYPHPLSFNHKSQKKPKATTATNKIPENSTQISVNCLYCC